MTDTPEAERVSIRAHRAARALIGITCLMFAVGGLIAGRIIFHEDQWSPLGPYPTQQVDADVVDGMPTVAVSAGVVKVRGRKCVTGSGYDMFVNTVPGPVAAAVHAQALAGVPAPVWRLTGTERPVDGERVGAELSWATEPFVLVDD